MSYRQLKECHKLFVNIFKVCGMKRSCVRDIEILYNFILIFD